MPWRDDFHGNRTLRIDMDISLGKCDHYTGAGEGLRYAMTDFAHDSTVSLTEWSTAFFCTEISVFAGIATGYT